MILLCPRSCSCSSSNAAVYIHSIISQPMQPGRAGLRVLRLPMPTATPSQSKHPFPPQSSVSAPLCPPSLLPQDQPASQAHLHPHSDETEIPTTTEPHQHTPVTHHHHIPTSTISLTLVPPHPNLQAASCATSSPNPSINPFTNGKNRFIAAPRNILQNVGGLYSINGEEEVSSEFGSGEDESAGWGEVEL